MKFKTKIKISVKEKLQRPKICKGWMHRKIRLFIFQILKLNSCKRTINPKILNKEMKCNKMIAMKLIINLKTI